ncbi:serine acetyltransferase [Flexivirga oryzae]|uniref:Serine acetyltransferase n=1 Tax=Flexivirga oryzae TaxID=1794944 RepID=A0A839N3G6_9MICO|nr:serine O-acetyltransferase [Flexivirga oryzae]
MSFSVLRSDFRAKAELMYGSTSASAILRAVAADGASAVILFRIGQIFSRARLAPFAFLLMKLNKLFNGVTIGSGASIGQGFVIQHSVGVVINGRAVMGANCVLEGGVVIGAVDRWSPQIGSGVYIGSGAKIVGRVTIGDNCKVGANAVVVKDAPAGSTIVGVPGVAR